MTPEAYNRIRGHAFAILVMDLVRTWHGQGDQRITMWSLTNHIAATHQLDAHSKKQLYQRIRGCVRQLVLSGNLSTRTEYFAEKNMTVKILTPC